MLIPISRPQPFCSGAGDVRLFAGRPLEAGGGMAEELPHRDVIKLIRFGRKRDQILYHVYTGETHTVSKHKALAFDGEGFGFLVHNSDHMDDDDDASI